MFDYLKADILRYCEKSDSNQFNLRSLFRGLLSQGFQAIIVYRFFRFLKTHGIPSQPLRFFLERFVEITTGISIPVSVDIGAGFRIHHFGGIILHPSARIGCNCTFYHQVTIGDRGGYGFAATIGDNVIVGAGAKIIGEVNIGNNCKIGANAVVFNDLPANTIAYGNPAIIKQRSAKRKI